MIYDAIIFANKNEMINTVKYLKDKSIKAEERLFNYIKRYTETLAEFPKPSRLLIKTLILDNDEEYKYDKDNKEIISTLIKLLSEISETSVNVNHRILSVILSSSIVLPFISQSYGIQFNGYDFNNKSERDEFINYLFNLVLSQLEKID